MAPFINRCAVRARTPNFSPLSKLIHRFFWIKESGSNHGPSIFVNNSISNVYSRNLATNSGQKPRSKNVFDSFLDKQQQQARCSVLVNLQSRQSIGDLHNYCKQFGNVEKMVFHDSKGKDMVLVVFASADMATAVVKSSAHYNVNSVIPIQSRLLSFHGKTTDRDRPSVLEFHQPLKEVDVYKELMTLNNISEQMEVLYQRVRLQDLSVRLRFLVALQLEESLHGMFPHCVASPFGSCVNGFGADGGDLDMVLTLAGNEPKTRGNMVFLTKRSIPNDRMHAQKCLGILGTLLSDFIPGVSRVVRILQATVPIVTFNHDYTNLECDLSVSNGTSICMSELLYMFGELDSRVRPLMFTIRHWAHHVGITQDSPGRWITNFQLTLLVLFYLQQSRPHPVLPPVKQLMQLAGLEDRREHDGVEVMFCRDLKKYPKSNNTCNLTDLLQGFFQFYAQFDFEDRAVSLVAGEDILKPDYSPLYLENPLQFELNASKNVGMQEIQLFKMYCTNSLWKLEAENNNNISKDDNTGLLRIFQKISDSERVIRKRSFQVNSVLEDSKVFEFSTDEPTKSLPPRNINARIAALPSAGTRKGPVRSVRSPKKS